MEASKNSEFIYWKQSTIINAQSSEVVPRLELFFLSSILSSGILVQLELRSYSSESLQLMMRTLKDVSPLGQDVFWSASCGCRVLHYHCALHFLNIPATCHLSCYRRKFLWFNGLASPFFTCDRCSTWTATTTMEASLLLSIWIR